jgi:hypothetical protein
MTVCLVNERRILASCRASDDTTTQSRLRKSTASQFWTSIRRDRCLDEIEAADLLPRMTRNFRPSGFKNHTRCIRLCPHSAASVSVDVATPSEHCRGCGCLPLSLFRQSCFAQPLGFGLTSSNDRIYLFKRSTAGEKLSLCLRKSDFGAFAGFGWCLGHCASFKI